MDFWLRDPDHPKPETDPTNLGYDPTDPTLLINVFAKEEQEKGPRPRDWCIDHLFYVPPSDSTGSDGNR